MSVVQVKMVGSCIGNQLHAYAAVRKYAQLHGATLETPDWIGRKLFNLNDPLWSKELPEVNDSGCGCPPAIEDGQVDVRLSGYFQFQRWASLLSRAELKQWFKIDPRWLALCGDRPGPWYTCCHLRRGDYVNHPLYCTVNEESYHKAMAQYNLPLGPLVWARQDQPRRVPALDIEGLDWLPDFVMLMRADVILRANSTFSWWAATLSDAAQIYSPVVEDLVGEHTVPFVLGNHSRCAHPSRVGVQVTDLRIND